MLLSTHTSEMTKEMLHSALTLKLTLKLHSPLPFLFELLLTFVF